PRRSPLFPYTTLFRSASMPFGFYLVMAAQFFSSLADNALLIAAIALIQQLEGPSWLAPMAKWSFALSYVLLAAFVGAFADSMPRSEEHTSELQSRENL